MARSREPIFGPGAIPVAAGLLIAVAMGWLISKIPLGFFHIVGLIGLCYFVAYSIWLLIKWRRSGG
jgi:hypothetical protein